MKPSEVRKMTDEELRIEENRLRLEAYHLRAKAVTEQLENPRAKAVLRKDVARVLTERRARELRQAQDQAQG